MPPSLVPRLISQPFIACSMKSARAHVTYVDGHYSCIVTSFVATKQSLQASTVLIQLGNYSEG